MNEYVIGTGIDITERKRVEETPQKRTGELDERVKELNCLYDISKVFEKQDLSLNQFVHEIIDPIPPAWQFPAITCAQLTLDGQVFKANNTSEVFERDFAAKHPIITATLLIKASL